MQSTLEHMETLAILVKSNGVIRGSIETVNGDIALSDNRVGDCPYSDWHLLLFEPVNS